MILALLKYMFAIQPYYDYCVHMISKNYVILVQSRRFKGQKDNFIPLLSYMKYWLANATV